MTYTLEEFHIIFKFLLLLTRLFLKLKIEQILQQLLSIWIHSVTAVELDPIIYRTCYKNYCEVNNGSLHYLTFITLRPIWYNRFKNYSKLTRGVNIASSISLTCDNRCSGSRGREIKGQTAGSMGYFI